MRAIEFHRLRVAMNETMLIALACVTFVWAIASVRFVDHDLTGPLVFLIAGFILANSDWGIVRVDIDSSTVHTLAEITLAFLLFTDASAVPLATVRGDLPLTSRLLGIGLPLSIVAGTGIAIILFPTMPVAVAGLLGASLAPTDAALSAPVIGDERLPTGLRRVLNVESGLNDGIATPVVTFCIAASATTLGLTGHPYDSGFGAVGELLIGVAIGVGVGFVGGRLVSLAQRRGWTQHGSRRLATLALALGAFVLASHTGGNPFVASFIGGLVFGTSAKADAEVATEFTEELGSLFSLVLWFVFGAAFVLPAFEQLDARIAIYALVSLTVVRMVPVAIALLGSGQDRPTTAFIGWFGPRGLASVVFALLAVEELGGADPSVRIAVDTIAVTIVFSVVAHGITARPLATRYVAAFDKRQRRSEGPSTPTTAV